MNSCSMLSAHQQLQTQRHVAAPSSHQSTWSGVVKGPAVRSNANRLACLPRIDGQLPSARWQQISRRPVLCASASMMDPADIIPSPLGDEDDDEDPSRVIPSATRVVVIGAGPVGLISAMYLARRGYMVQVFEKSPHPALRHNTLTDHPVVLSARALMALEELGAKALLDDLASRPLRGTWHMAAPGGSTLQENPGPSQRYTRRVLVGQQHLEQKLAEEARRLFPNRISIRYSAEFSRIEWDPRWAIINVAAGSGAGVALGCSLSYTQGRCLLLDSGRAEGGVTAPVDPLLPELSEGGNSSDLQEIAVPYGLLIGADGADSAVRSAIERREPRPIDFEVQRPAEDTREYKGVHGLPQVVSVSQPVPGLAAHGPREYLYEYHAAGAPSVQLWRNERGTLDGSVQSTYSWDAISLAQTLQQAYGASMPVEWQTAIVQQTCGPDALPAHSFGRTVQCSQFHGPRIALVGDAAHAMTTEYNQGLNCAVEGVRLLNLALKSTADSLDRALPLYSEVRCEDAHCMQQLEFFKRSVAPGLKFGDPMYKLASLLGALVWRCALAVLAIAQALLPKRFSPNYVEERMWDARRGYSDLFKVVMRFAAGPIVLAFVGMVLGIRAAMSTKGISLLGALV